MRFEAVSTRSGDYLDLAGFGAGVALEGMGRGQRGSFVALLNFESLTSDLARHSTKHSNSQADIATKGWLGLYTNVPALL